MANVEDVMALQEKIVRCFANALDVRWDFLLVDFERQEDAHERVTDTYEVAFQREGSAWKRVSIISPIGSADLLNDLAVLMAKDGGETWSICTVEIERSGRYRFCFSYGRPNRLNGDLEDQRLLNYVPRPLT